MALRSAGDPILFINNPAGVSPNVRRTTLDEIRALNELNFLKVGDPETHTRIEQFELAFRMQSSVPELTAINHEPDSTYELYGNEAKKAGTFANSALLARRMVERGVRIALVLHGAGGDRWDDHGDIKGRIPTHCREVDRPIAGLLKDLKSRGLIEETLVVWASEMGRTPFDNNLVTDKPGRDHNQYGLVVWMAGGGVRPGATFGETDDFGLRNASAPIPIRDIHATVLRLMGLDQDRLSFLHAGRFKRLTDIGGRVISEVLA